MSCPQNNQTIMQLEQFCQKGVRPFKSNEDILENARWLFSLRLLMNPGKDGKFDEKFNRLNAPIERKATRILHRCLKATSGRVPIVGAFGLYHLNHIEREIFLLLILSHFGMLGNVDRLEDIQQYVNNASTSRAIAVTRTLSKNGRLIRKRLLTTIEMMEELRYKISEEIVVSIINKKKLLVKDHWNVESYEELLDRLLPLIRELRNRASAIEALRDRGVKEDEVIQATRDINHLLWQLYNTLKKHPSWQLNVLRRSNLTPKEKLILLVLVGKDLGFFSPGDDLFTGSGLARCVCERPHGIRYVLGQLKQDMSLQKKGYIRICGGTSNNCVVEDEGTIQSCEFELTDEFSKKLDIKRYRKTRLCVRKPIVKFDQMVLSEKVKSSIEMCLAQVRGHKTLFEQWELGKTFSYGTGITMLFSGPSGTGKTACAEAIADQLDKSIIAVNYAEIQNFWVGQTEKNIVRVFWEAKDANAVLFWDEADAMFYDRDMAVRNWEVRDVNVLLQELERFEGVCILSTNRKGSLDKALERRISMKIEFERPDRKTRQEIWQKLIPPKMPLDKDVSLDELSRMDLSGGEIKNVILNAARIALKNNTDPSDVCRMDFMEAIRMEREGSWSGSHETFGFRAT